MGIGEARLEWGGPVQNGRKIDKWTLELDSDSLCPTSFIEVESDVDFGSGP